MKVRHDMITVFVARPLKDGKSHELLQLLRARDDYMGGTWQIVRGCVEAGETYVQAALREMREETGLAPREFFRLGNVESFYTAQDDTLWHSVCFVAMVSSDAQVRLNEEHEALRWLGDDRIEAEVMWASERPFYAEIRRDIFGNGPAKPHLRISL
jgi:dihydroneopterin triphosphate diphosphatase